MYYTTFSPNTLYLHAHSALFGHAMSTFSLTLLILKLMKSPNVSHVITYTWDRTGKIYGLALNSKIGPNNLENRTIVTYNAPMALTYSID